jgi:hypothetical protein
MSATGGAKITNRDYEILEFFSMQMAVAIGNLPDLDMECDLEDYGGDSERRGEGERELEGRREEVARLMQEYQRGRERVEVDFVEENNKDHLMVSK